MQKLKLYGFNNLTKNLSFCIYDICYAKTTADRYSYLVYINEKYNTTRLTEILTETCSIIDANILNLSKQDYEPQGASVTILISENSIDIKDLDNLKNSGILSNSIVTHLDKSHICVHTYPESHPDDGICTFRTDIEVSTCGIISPLKTLNYLIYQLESDIVTIDYRIRGFTRDVNGVKLYIDHEIQSIQNYITEEFKSQYNMIDVNLYQENFFHTKMILKDLELNLNNYLFNTTAEQLSLEEKKRIIYLLKKEMKEIYYGRNLTEM
ncbi:MAG: adenosylmethionine decarboxylase [Arsenophonus sp.]